MSETAYVVTVHGTDRYGNAVLLRETPHEDPAEAEHDAAWARYCGMRASVTEKVI